MKPVRLLPQARDELRMAAAIEAAVVAVNDQIGGFSQESNEIGVRPNYA